VNTLANIKSAKKRIIVTELKTAKNKRIKSVVKTAIKRFEETLAAGNLEEANDKLRYAEKQIRKAVAKGTIHKNTASKKISGLANKINKAKQQQAI
jgi:small subunit ribosomal protein S20